MLHKTLSLFAVALTFASPLSAIEEAPAAAPVDVGVHVTATSFFARNYSPVDQVLLFKSGDALAWRTLAPGCDLSWDFPTQLLDGIQLEIASWTASGWKRTGTVQLENIAARGADALWVQGDPASTSWTEIASVMLLEPTGESIFPETLPGADGDDTQGLLMTPVHVPVITPSDEPVGDVPPEIEERPLPPV